MIRGWAEIGVELKADEFRESKILFQFSKLMLNRLKT